MQPGGHVELGVRPVQVLVCPDEALLGKVERIFLVSHHSIGKRIDLPLIALNKRFERGMVSGFRLAYQQLFVGCHARFLHRNPIC